MLPISMMRRVESLPGLEINCSLPGRLLLRDCQKVTPKRITKVSSPMNRTRGFVNLNRFKSGRAIKRLGKVVYNKGEKKGGKK